MDLTITRAHGRKAERGSYTNCPAVKALKAAGFTDVRVTETEARVDGASFDLPQTLVDAILDYDDGTAAFRYGTYRIPGLKRPSTKASKHK